MDFKFPKKEQSVEDTLIELVRRNPCLYDKDDKNYKNFVKKEKAWETISSQIGISEKKLKVRWKSLRNSYRVELLKTRENPDKESRWRFFDSLHFLEDNIGTMTKLGKYWSESVSQHQDETAQHPYEMMEPTTFSCTMLQASNEDPHIESASEEVSPALLNFNERPTTTSSLGAAKGMKTEPLSFEAKYEHFLEGASNFLDSGDLTPTELFMQSMAAKVEKANLTENEIDEIQEAILSVVNKHLRIFRERRNKR